MFLDNGNLEIKIGKEIIQFDQLFLNSNYFKLNVLCKI